MMSLQKNPLVLGVSGAVLASMCCATPVLLVTFGLATSSVVLAWLNLKPIFLALAAVVLVGGLTINLLRSKQACSTTRFHRRLWLYPLVTAVSFAAGYYLLMDVATPRLYSQVYAADRAAVAHNGVVLASNGQVVALRRATFKIYMGCEGCASTLRTVFLGLTGVHAAAVDIKHKTVSVLYDPTRIEAKAIQAKIPYPWYYTPHLAGVMTPTAPSTSTVQTYSMLGLLALIAAAFGLMSAGVWSTTRRRI
jgi:copper chaperone CopZ